MKLAAYLASARIEETDFAARLGVSTKAVRHWLLGKRIPRAPQMQSIREATSGAVMPNDFLPTPSHAASQPSEAAE